MINFQNAQFLTMGVENQFFGNGFRYKTVKNISIEGFVDDLRNTEGVSGILSGQYDIIKGAVDFQPITINNTNFGYGKISSISFDQGTWVRSNQYTVQLQIIEDGNILVTGSFYSGIDFSLYNLVESFDESITFDRAQDNTSTYSHSINLKVNSGEGVNVHPRSIAQVIAKNLFISNNLTGFLGDYKYLNLSQKTLFTETYNEIDFTCQFEKRIEFLNRSGNYSIDFEYELTRGSDGVSQITENAEIRGLTQPAHQYALSGYFENIPNAYNRCTGIFYGYFTGGYLLSNNPLNKSIQRNIFDGTMGYTINFNNDPRNQTGYRWEYKHDINISQNTTTVSEGGTILGLGKRDQNREKYFRALQGWNQVYPGITGRVNGFYVENKTPNYDLFFTKSVYSESWFNGTIEYNYEFSDDSTLTSGMKKEEIIVSDTFPINASQPFNIVGVGEILQTQNQTTLGQRSLKVNFIGQDAYTQTDYRNRWNTLYTQYSTISGADDIFLKELSYNFNPTENTFSITANLNYDIESTSSLYRTKEDIQIR